MVYKVDSNLSARVNALNTPWNAPPSAMYCQHAQFKKAMKICEKEFIHKIHTYVNIKLPAYNIVLDCWNAKDAFHPSG